jgi:4-hydroxybenzoate polyprenyltransferase
LRYGGASGLAEVVWALTQIACFGFEFGLKPKTTSLKFLRSILVLGRVSNLPTVWTNVMVGWLVGGGIIEWEVLWLMLGASLIYLAGMTLNDACDVKWDHQHAPERPIPSGAISLAFTWLIGGLEMAGGIALLLWKSHPNILVLAGLVGAVILYDLIHKHWKGAVLVMGLCRALVYLLAWGAARAEMQLHSPSPLVYLLGGGVLLYIAGITLAARSERSQFAGGLETLPRLLLLLPISFPFLVQYCEQTFDISIPYLLLGMLLNSFWIVFFRSLLASGKVMTGIGHAIAGLALYDASVAVLLDWQAGVFCLICFGLTLVAQRLIPAT